MGFLRVLEGAHGVYYKGVQQGILECSGWPLKVRIGFGIYIYIIVAVEP